jgi:allophanate hydrolase subunit 1
MGDFLQKLRLRLLHVHARYHSRAMLTKVARAGDRALLIELGEVTAAELQARAAEARAHSAVVACVPGQQSLYVIFRGRPDVSVLSGVAALPSASQHRRMQITVSFRDEYGPDLAAFLEHSSISRSDFLARLSSIRLTARYLGFRGGFAYLEGWPSEWAMPRRPTSRPVARGSFAIAGQIAGFYPIDSPGGWNVLGRTGQDLENAIVPGDEIELVPSEETLGSSVPAKETTVTLNGVSIDGPLATVVAAADEARLERGLPSGGPFDPRAASLANRLVGNSEDAPVIECALAGPRIRFESESHVAWLGGDSSVAQGVPFSAREVVPGRIRNGLRGYLAVGGGGGGQPASLTADMAAAVATHVAAIRSDDRLRIRVLRGPHESPLGSIECEVTPRLDRVGIRLRPVIPLSFSPPADQPSCGMQFGTIQLHPDGSLVAMGPDHPVTGGYLQPLTVLSDERWKLAYLTPGELVWFVDDEEGASASRGAAKSK